MNKDFPQIENSRTEEIREVIESLTGGNTFKLSAFCDNASFSHDLGQDSLGANVLILGMEKELSVNLPFDIEVSTVGDLINAVIKAENLAKPLESMPSKEEMEKGLDELLDMGIATKLNEANAENGVFFDTLELNFKGNNSFRENAFIKGFAIKREAIFRKTGEGTGASSDWSEIDEYVRQTITWDPEEKVIVSASRMAVPAETLDKPTFFKNLYETTEEFEKNILEKSAELGRTFLNADFLSHLRTTRNIDKLRPAVNSLFSGVWQQFNKLLEEGHMLKYLHGAVSIDSRYSEQSLRRYAALYTQNFPAEKMFDLSMVKAKEGVRLLDIKMSEFELESWVDSGDFEKSEIKLKQFLSKEAQESGAKHPELFKRYPSFVGNQEGACSYFSPVQNKERKNCLEIGLLLDVSKIPLEIEQGLCPKRKNLKKDDSLALRTK